MTSTEIILHAPEFQNESKYIHNQIEDNLIGKLDAYIRKTAKEWDKIRVELTLTRDKKFISGKLAISFPGSSYRSLRENFVILDELISHLFVHVKEQMGK